MSTVVSSGNAEALVDGRNLSTASEGPLFPPHQPPRSTFENLPPPDEPCRHSRFRLRRPQSLSDRSPATERRP
jgi:hypothetical protein